MAFAGSTAIRLLSDAGLSGGGPRLWEYTSPDASTLVCNVTGYMAGMGAGSRGGSPVGLKVGDVFFVKETTGSSGVGRTVLASVISSTLNAAGTYVTTYGYDVTLSQSSTA